MDEHAMAVALQDLRDSTEREIQELKNRVAELEATLEAKFATRPWETQRFRRRAAMGDC